MKDSIQIEWKFEKKSNHNLKISEGRIVRKKGVITKKEIVEYDVVIWINASKEEERYIVEWNFAKVRHQFLGIDKEDIDKSEKSLEGVKIQYALDSLGKVSEFKKANKVSRKIKGNVKKRLDEDIRFGMRPEDEPKVEEFMEELFSELNTKNIFDFVKKFHDKYGLELKINIEEKNQGIFNRKIAKKKIPAIKIVSVQYDDEQHKLKYRLHQEIDIDKTMQIFEIEKEDEAFRPFKRDNLKEAIEQKIFNCEYKEEFVYDTQLGLMTNYEEHKYSKFGTPIIEDFLIMKIT